MNRDPIKSVPIVFTPIGSMKENHLFHIFFTLWRKTFFNVNLIQKSQRFATHYEYKEIEIGPSSLGKFVEMNTAISWLLMTISDHMFLTMGTDHETEVMTALYFTLYRH